MLRRFGMTGLVAVLVAAAGFGAAGCGSDDSSSGSTSTAAASTGASTTASDTSSPGIARAKAIVAKYNTNVPLEIAPLPKRPKSGLTVAQVNCTLAGCGPGELAKAAKALGWKVNTFAFDLTKGPTDFLRAMKEAIASKPDLLVSKSIFPQSLVAKQVAQARASGIPTINVIGTSAGFDACIQCDAAYQPVFSLSSDIALADAGKPTSIAIAHDPSLATDTTARKIMENEIKKNGDGTKIKAFELSLAQPPAKNGAATVSFLQRNPDVKYILYASPDLFNGTYPALKAAGLADKAKVVLSFPNNQVEIDWLKSGQIFAYAVGEKSHEWRQVDALARLSEGLQVTPKDPLPWTRVMFRPDASLANANPPDFQQVYDKAWKVSG
jgi:ABC-type sugar transport system substrate-binding protein